MSELSRVTSIILPLSQWDEITAHGRRKMAGEFLEGETPVRRAYGMVTGRIDGTSALVYRIVPFKKNARSVEPLKSYMDKMMERYAIPSKTPMEQRGWITDPEELLQCYDFCDQEGLVALGTYHMHTVAWDHDPLRDTPTRLDRVLAANSGLFMFVISFVQPAQPVIRAFYEGDIEQEVPVVFEGEY